MACNEPGLGTILEISIKGRRMASGRLCYGAAADRGFNRFRCVFGQCSLLFNNGYLCG